MRRVPERARTSRWACAYVTPLTPLASGPPPSAASTTARAQRRSSRRMQSRRSSTSVRLGDTVSGPRDAPAQSSPKYLGNAATLVRPGRILSARALYPRSNPRGSTLPPGRSDRVPSREERDDVGLTPVLRSLCSSQPTLPTESLDPQDPPLNPSDHSLVRCQAGAEELRERAVGVSQAHPSGNRIGVMLIGCPTLAGESPVP